MQKTRVSIVMATYNGEGYLVKQLKSILCQTLIPDEVIIYDDASTDRTCELVRCFIVEYNLNSWFLFANSKNIGYRKNFYNAIGKATGDIIFLCDQDDEWREDKVEQMVNVFKSHKGVLALSCAVKLIDKTSQELQYKCEHNYYNGNFLYLTRQPGTLQFFDVTYIAKHNISPGCTTAITHSLAQQFLIYYNFKLPHDWFLNMLAASKSGCAFLNKPLVYYRRHNNNTIGANTGPIEGIIKKTRYARIEDFMERIDTIKTIILIDNIQINSLNDIFALYKKMIAFYRSPNIFRLFELRKNPSYYELAKRKVRLWECIVALRLDKIIKSILVKFFRR